MTVRILIGDVREQLKTLADESVHCVVTSPPYWSLRCYGVDGQMGSEPTYQEHVSAMVDVFREVRRVLRKDGTLFLNYGDSYVSAPPGNTKITPARTGTDGAYLRRMDRQLGHGEDADSVYTAIKSGLKPKNMVGMPWRIAFALQADGWILRQDIIWAKPNPMPESVKDRCTKAHEYIFLLSKSPRYYFDAEAIKEEAEFGRGTDPTGRMFNRVGTADRPPEKVEGGKGHTFDGYRNKRSVWEIATSPFPEAHFATFPPELPETCIRAGSKVGDTILDPFGGAGTTGLVADRLQRNAILIELNPQYAEMAKKRIYGDNPLFTEMA